MIPGSCPAKAMVGRGVKVGRRLGVRELLWKEDVSQEESRQARAGLSRRSEVASGLWGRPHQGAKENQPTGGGAQGERGRGLRITLWGQRLSERTRGPLSVLSHPGTCSSFPILGLRKKSGLSRGRRRPWTGCAHLDVPWDTAPVTQ